MAERTLSSTIDLKYQMPESDVNKYITEISSDGINVHPDTDNGWKVQISNGVYILNSNDKPVNQMTKDGNIIGYADETHAHIDYHSFEMIDKEGYSYFYIGDLRTNHTSDEKYGEGFYYVNTDTFIADSIEREFDLTFSSITDNYSVAIDNIEVTSGVQKKKRSIKFDTAPEDGKIIEVFYPTNDTDIKAYTLGIRENNSVKGAMSVAENFRTIASGDYSHAEGNYTIASGNNSHAEGHSTEANGDSSHAEGNSTKANGNNSHAEGDNTYAIGLASHAEGEHTQARGHYSHVEGSGNNAQGQYSHAEGGDTTASGIASHAEGAFTTASGNNSHTEGCETTASGSISHAEGNYTTASGNNSHAEGLVTTASGDNSHAQNYYTIAGYACQTAIGKWNDNQPNTAFEIGNGTSNNARSNAFTVDLDGIVSARDKNNRFSDIFDLLYPVGSYYHTSDPDFDPEESWGGEWSLLGEGQVLLSGSENGTYQVGNQYGGNSKRIEDSNIAHGHGFTNPTISGGSHAHGAGDNLAFMRYNQVEVASGVSERSVASGASGNYKAPVINNANVDYSYASRTQMETPSMTASGGSVQNLGTPSSRSNFNVMQLSTATYIWHRTA